MPARTAPAEGTPGGNGSDAQPTPAGSAGAAGPEVVDKLEHQQFAQRTRDKYGFNPSLVS